MRDHRPTFSKLLIVAVIAGAVLVAGVWWISGGRRPQQTIKHVDQSGHLPRGSTQLLWVFPEDYAEH